MGNRNIRISDLDVLILSVLYKLPWAMDYHIALLTGEPVKYIRRRLQQLAEGGLVRRMNMMADRTALNVITSKGIAEAGFEPRNVTRPTYFSVEHDLGVIDTVVYLALLNKNGKYLTEFGYSLIGMALGEARMKNIDKYRGCLIGGAAGDALGYAIEFYDEGSIFQRYGETGITEYELVNGIAQISDDTQMTLFTANGLLLGTTRGMTRGIMGSYPSYVAFCYKDWLRTQTSNYPADHNNPYAYTWLINIPELFDRGAPGNTCLSAINAGAHGTIEDPINNSKGCGGVMRVAPVGLYFESGKRSDEELDQIGASDIHI